MKIGCFTLPYRTFPLERALEGIARAGFGFVGIWPEHESTGSNMPEGDSQPFVDAVRRAIESAGLVPTVLFGRTAPTRDEGLAAFLLKIEQAGALGCSELLAWGPWPWKEFLVQRRPEEEWKAEVEGFFRLLPDIARKAEQVGVTVAYKPHCGLTAASRELAEIVERARSDRIRISYDGGNVSFYEGLDPAEDIKPIAASCSSLIVKDHKGGRGARDFSNVGEGAVDHRSMMATLVAAGFAGPVSVEKITGNSAEELDRSAAESFRVLQGYADEIARGAGAEGTP